MRKVIWRKKSIGITYCLNFTVILMAAVFLGMLLFNEAIALPSGSYQQSCKTNTCTDTGTTLKCECSYKGKYSWSTLDYSKCQDGSIWNEKGTLMCTPGSDFPAGSYKQTCGNCSDDGSRLTCQCKYTGNYSTTSLNYTKCQDGNIWNEKSKLMCTPGSDFPAGSYKQTCGNCSDDGSKLICQCRYKGNYSTTSLWYGLCENQPWNENGKLKCKPRGSFKNSCWAIDWNEFRIQAICRTKKGKQSGTTLNNWIGCSGDIANCDGHLNCGGCP